MCNSACIDFGLKSLSEPEVKGKSVLEVGALDVNGSFRSLIENLHPQRYLGVDIAMGPGVDEICDAIDLINKFGKEKFDILVSTEMLEHVRDWRKVCSNLKQILKPGGIILITTRSKGTPYHGHPFDFWRYELSDIKNIFSDFSILSLDKDPMSPGIFLKAKKPVDFTENNMEGYKLYSIIKNSFVEDISNSEILKFRILYVIRNAPFLIIGFVKSCIKKLIGKK